MSRFNCLVTATAAALIVLSSAADIACAQQPKSPSAPAAQPAPSTAAPDMGAAEVSDFKQMALTDKQVQGLLEAQKDLDSITGKLPDDKAPDQKVIRQLDTIAKKYGFADYAEYSAVAANVDMLLDGFDPQTKKFVGFEAVLKSQIDHIQADTKISPSDKKEALEELNAAMTSVPKVEFPANIDVVAKYYDRLNDTLRGQE